MNLLCASGLPGGENLDIAQCLAKLDDWAKVVAVETERFRPNFRPNPSCPTDAQFRCYMVIKVLRDVFNVKHYLLPNKGTGIYGPLKCTMPGTPARFDDSKLLLIHGLLSDERIGSCSSLPVLFTAVGQRLGYPINLAIGVQHIFIRWEDDHEQFNMEGTGPDFINSHPSEYYIDQPRPWTQHERTCSAFLRSLTAAESLAAFLFTRGGCLEVVGRTNEALQMMREAHRMHPEHPHYFQAMNRIDREMSEHRMRTMGPMRQS